MSRPAKFQSQIAACSKIWGKTADDWFQLQQLTPVAVGVARLGKPWQAQMCYRGRCREFQEGKFVIADHGTYEAMQ